MPTCALIQGLNDVGFTRGRASSLGIGANPAFDDAPRRLSILAALVATVWALYMALYQFVFDQADLLGQVMSLAAIVGSLVTIALLRRWKERPASIVRLGLVYEVFLCGVGAFTENGNAELLERVPSGVSWNCVLIVAFPFVVPMSPQRTQVASLLAAFTTMVAGLIALNLTSGGLPRTPVLVALFLPPFLCAAIAYVPARLLSQLGDEVKRARRMGSYQLVERIGEGGMGEVWRAEHALLARPAAVKLIRPDIDPQKQGGYERALRRFEREARATAALESPHTVELYDYGVGDGGTFYYVMELLNGIDLETLVAEHGPLSPERAVFLLRQICRSLDDAHVRGLFHRDIKPANVFVGRRAGSYDYVKVLDFGLVTGERSPGIEDVRLTRDAEITGTPAYMAPEMATGEHPIDARTDLYSLGCVAYWLLTGQLVFDEGSAMKTAVAHVTAEPLPPSQRAGREIPAALERLVLQCLAKQQGDRPASAAALEQALGDTGLDVGWNQERAARWWQQHEPDRVAAPTASDASSDGTRQSA